MELRGTWSASRRLEIVKVIQIVILINVKTDEASLNVTAFVLFAVTEYYVSECIDYTCAKTETTQVTTKKEKELNETTANVWTGADRNIDWQWLYALISVKKT